MSEVSDVLIVGNGPAGISAALYATRAGLKTTVIGKDGGALNMAGEIENYYGFEQPISGNFLISQGISQAKRLGAELITGEVIGISYNDSLVVQTKDKEYMADSVILATGSSRSAPKINGLKEFEGRGISYCAVCDGFFYRGKDVGVLGNGEYAIHEAMQVLPIAKSVTLLTNGKNPDAEVPAGINVSQKEIKAFTGEGVLEQVLFQDGSVLDLSGIFIAVGVAGSSDLAKKLGAQTDGTRVVVNDKMETTIPGLFAAGDCTGGMLQIAKAVYEGAKAGSEAIKYIRKKDRDSSVMSR